MSWSVRLALYRKAAVYLPRDLNEKVNIYLPERNLKPFWLQTAVAENWAEVASDTPTKENDTMYKPTAKQASF